jgi:hypothetical protein
MDFVGLLCKRAARHPMAPVDAPAHDGPPTNAEQPQHFQIVAEMADQCPPADLQQLLDQICRRIDHRIERYRRVTALFEASGDVEYAWTFRRMTRVEEQDLQIFEGLLEDLRVRFDPRAAE